MPIPIARRVPPPWPLSFLPPTCCYDHHPCPLQEEVDCDLHAVFSSVPVHLGHDPDTVDGLHRLDLANFPVAIPPSS